MIAGSVSAQGHQASSALRVFNAENRALNWIVDGKGKRVELNPSMSTLSTRFSFVVCSDRSIALYPLNPDADSQSAVSYEFRVTPTA